MAKEHQRTADQLKQLEQQLSITNEQRALAGGQPAIASPLRDALADLQQNELAMRMKKNAEWIRRGLGGTTWGREALITQGTDRLNDQLQEARPPSANRASRGISRRAATSSRDWNAPLPRWKRCARKPNRCPAKSGRCVRGRNRCPAGVSSNLVRRGTRRRAEV